MSIKQTPGRSYHCGRVSVRNSRGTAEAPNGRPGRIPDLCFAKPSLVRGSAGSKSFCEDARKRKCAMGTNGMKISHNGR
jgi:hypothetical protein